MTKKLYRILALLCMFALVLGMTAYAEEAPASIFSPDGSVLFEADGLKVTTAGLDYDPTDYEPQPIIWVDIENTGMEDAYLGLTNGSVNGWMTDVVFVEFYMEDGEYWWSSYDFSLTVPAGSSERYALGYYKNGCPGVDMDTLAEMTFCFTLAEEEYAWPSYTSEPVTIVTGEALAPADIASLGTVVLDNETLRLVLGEQDYDEWFGPLVYVYAENKSADYIGLSADAAEADGVSCDYLLYGATLAPGKMSANMLSFEGDMQALKGFENLSLSFSLYQSATDELDWNDAIALEPVSVQYPPQVWGEYENAGLHLDIQPKYNELLTVEVPQNDEDGFLFSVSETASLEAGGYEGAGWLFSIAKIDKETLHELLCYDTSGATVIAKDDEDCYYLFCQPTDVRFERETVEEMYSDAERWTMLCDWAETVKYNFADKNGLEYVSFGNSEVETYLARAAWMDGVKATLSTTEYGPVDIADVDGTPYAEYLMQGWFWETDPEETPDGEYVVLDFPDEDVRLDFFFAEGSYIRVTSYGMERLYQSSLYDGAISGADVMRGWYYAAAEQAGLKAADENLDPFLGMWYEKVAGRGMITVMRSLAPGKVKIEVNWAESAAVMDTWEMTATLMADGTLVYDDGEFASYEYDENGEAWQIDGSWGLSGTLSLNGEGELLWSDILTDGTFVR